MATVPPTPDEVDAWYMANASLVSQAVVDPGQPQSLWILAWTQNDGTPQFTIYGDPTADLLTSQIAAGLNARYGQITVRGYTYTAALPTPAVTDMAMPADEQARLNDPASWPAP